ncbi:MAG: glycosyltransferase, partial [Candidatus Aminicenantes bacterium]|nr:glycosyltransferase [Candidatus Aminicenantes bacterium]
SEIKAWKAGHGLAGKRLIGFLGNFFKRRHVPEIIAAQEILRKRHPDMVLLLIGETHAVPENTLKKNKSDFLWLQRLPENELNVFYSSLCLFLYISEYEGFGLPPMEALNCGTISLLLRRSSLAELYGDTALFLERPDPDRIAAAISDFLQDEEHFKSRLLSRWQTQKKYFSWKRAAEEYLREIESLPCKSS